MGLLVADLQVCRLDTLRIDEVANSQELSLFILVAIEVFLAHLLVSRDLLLRKVFPFLAADFGDLNYLQSWVFLLYLLKGLFVEKDVGRSWLLWLNHVIKELRILEQEVCRFLAIGIDKETKGLKLFHFTLKPLDVLLSQIRKLLLFLSGDGGPLLSNDLCDFGHVESWILNHELTPYFV